MVQVLHEKGPDGDFCNTDEVHFCQDWRLVTGQHAQGVPFIRGGGAMEMREETRDMILENVQDVA